ncbi:YcjF family protein [Thalassotalea fusca]
MNEKETKYQQQILFDEVPKVAEKQEQNTNLVTSQVIVENETWQEDELHVETQLEQALPKSKPRWLWRLIAVLLPVLLAVELVQFFITGFESSPIITSIYAIVFTSILALAGRFGFKEYLGLRQLKRSTKLREMIAIAIDKKQSEEAVKLCDKIHARLPCDLTVEYENKWQKSAKQELSAEEIIALYDQQVLTSVDKKALDVIAKHATESVVLVAVSPVAIIDMALIFWRNVKMLDELAHLYGIHLSYWSRIRLIKQVFVNMAYAGASELIADVGLEMIGADILGKVSARFAQGMGAGMLTARLGLKAMHECRPLAFTGNKPKLTDVRKAIVKRLGNIKTK